MAVPPQFTRCACPGGSQASYGEHVGQRRCPTRSFCRFCKAGALTSAFAWRVLRPVRSSAKLLRVVSLLTAVIIPHFHGRGRAHPYLIEIRIAG
eukprot:5460727-Pleurochrysis_carterae.AAC.1